MKRKVRKRRGVSLNKQESAPLCADVLEEFSVFDGSSAACSFSSAGGMQSLRIVKEKPAETLGIFIKHDRHAGALLVMDLYNGRIMHRVNALNEKNGKRALRVGDAIFEVRCSLEA